MLSTALVIFACTSERSKAKSAFSHPAVYKLKLCSSIKAECRLLCSSQSDVLAIPGQVFAFYRAVPNNDVFSVPKSVFSVKNAVFKNRIFNVLKGIFALHAHVLKKCRPAERSIKYSLWAEQSRMSRLLTDHPNSGEMMSQPDILYRCIRAGP